MNYKKYRGRPSLRLEGADYGTPVTYAVSFNTKGRAPHFRDPRLAASLLSIIIRTRLEEGFYVYGYCIMPDHVHLMIQPLGKTTLPRIVRLIKGRMTASFRKTRPAVKLWQRGYVDNVINGRREFESVFAYIILNPIKGGLSEREYEYPFSGVLDYFNL
ncbi:MAG: transposase [Candidatus Zixiibacteriota bacterium]